MGALDERERFEAIFATYWKPVLGFAARRCTTPADASDVAADVFLTAWRQIGRIPAGEDARLWLYGVARRQLANHRRGEIRRDRLGRTLLDAWTEASDADPIELFAARAASSDALRVALGTLRRVDVDLLTLTAWEGLTSAQAASVVGISPDAARTRLSRARRRLRNILRRSRPDTVLAALTMEEPC